MNNIECYKNKLNDPDIEIFICGDFNTRNYSKEIKLIQDNKYYNTSLVNTWSPSINKYAYMIEDERQDNQYDYIFE